MGALPHLSRDRCIGGSAVLAGTTVHAQPLVQNAVPQENVDIIGPTPAGVWEACEPTMQQNEPDGIRSLVFPGHLAMGVNDYRCVNDREIGEAWPGIATSTDFGRTWLSGLVPAHLKDDPNIGQKGGADPNLEIAPYIMYYNYIAYWRDDSRPGGIYTARFYEPNREVGVPFRYLDTSEDVTGTASQFNDKPSFRLAFFDPDEGRPDIEFDIPAYTNPLNPADSHPAYTLKTPAHRLHLCFTKFVGNDNNDGTKVECLASDDGGRTYPIKNKLSESVEINQGTSIATRNGGRDVVVVWARFREPQDKQLGAVMYAMSTDYGNSFSKAKVITEFCPFNQSTGAARFRTNALPSIVSDGNRFSVYIAARNDATEACFLPGKGNNPDEILLSDVMFADDFDDYNEDRDAGGKRIKDGKVRTSLNFARIMRIEGTGSGNLSWGIPEAIDPATDVNKDGKTVRQRFHQFMVACDAASGVETCTFTDNRLDKFNTLLRNLPARPFVEDMVLHLEPGEGGPNAKVVPTLLPAGAYEGVPDPSLLPPNRNNLPLRSTLEQFVFQVKDGIVRPYTVNSETFHVTDPSDPQAISSPSARITRFATRQKPGAPAGTEQQVVWDYGNPRAFQKGKSSFNGDYSALFGESARQRESDLKWESNQDAPDPALHLFSSLESEFHAGWTSNHKIRGKVWYTGCDTWNEDLQMWEAGAGCDSPYTQVDGRLLPLQGEDGSSDGAPLTCSAAFALNLARAPLTRDQTVMTAALTPGISAFIVSAIKPADGGKSTFVMQIRNGTPVDRLVEITIPGGVSLSFGPDAADSLLSIPVIVPANSGNVRTIFDFGDLDLDPTLPTTMVAEVTDPANGDARLARIALNRESLDTPPLGNVQSNPDAENPTTVDLLLTEYYDLALQREFALDPTRAVLSLESFDLENTPELFELENLDFATFDLENKLVFFDLENFELENFELENTDLRNDLYQAFDLENILINFAGEDENEEQLLYFDLENFELENFELENFDLENFDLENFELENFDLENFELENFELENESAKASSFKNFELENFELENAAPGDPYSEVSWRADSLSNTTTGVDIQPIFSPTLAQQLVDSGATVLLTVRQAYLRPTVGFAGSLNSCSAEIVVDNQILYVEELDDDQILAAQFNGTINDPDPTNPFTPGFPMNPDGTIVISMRVINSPVSGVELSEGMGIGLFAQPGDVLNCDLELPGDETDDLCEVSFEAPDTTEPVIVGLPEDPPPGTPFVLELDQGTYYYEVSGISADDDVDGSVDVMCTPGTLIDSTGGIFTYAWDFAVGDTTVTCTATDAAGNTVTESFTATVVDEQEPTITLNGANPQYILEGEPYVELGATATDNVDSNAELAAALVIDASGVNTSVPGEYSVTYNVSDASANPAVEVVRTVIVTDGTPPVVTITDDPLIITALADPVTVTEAELDANVTVNDLVDGDGVIDPDCSISESPLLIGNTYTASCTATDTAGNSTTVTFDVEIRFAWEITIVVPNGNKRAGSVIPVDWYYTQGGSRIDSGGLPMSVEWLGPYTGNNCSGVNTGLGDGNDAGSSGFRYTVSQNQWQYSWQTPELAGSYLFVVTPPGTEASGECVNLK